MAGLDVDRVVEAVARAAGKTGPLALLEPEFGRNVVLVIDEDGRLTGIHNLKELLAPVVSDSPVFLMAGGFGTRLRPLTDDCPKPMLKIGNKPILESTLESFIAAGFHRFFIADKIKGHFKNGERWGVDITYVEEEQPLDTAGALGLLPPLGDVPLLMMNGDVMTSVDFRALLAFHVQKGSVATMGVRAYDLQVPYGVVEAIDDRIQAVVEKPVQVLRQRWRLCAVAPGGDAGAEELPAGYAGITGRSHRCRRRCHHVPHPRALDRHRTVRWLQSCAGPIGGNESVMLPVKRLIDLLISPDPVDFSRQPDYE
jgi:hypothetical protein